jgi:hypothetical protein
VVFDDTSHWIIGTGPRRRRLQDGNILMGPRCTLDVLNSSSVVVRDNYSHHNYRGEWSQGFNLITTGSSPNLLVEHNLIRGGSWPVQGLAGEFRYNLVVGYATTGSDGGDGSADPPQPLARGRWRAGQRAPSVPALVHERGQDVRIYNNTMDGGGPTGDFAGPFVEIDHSLIEVPTLRNNLFTMPAPQNGGPGEPLVRATDNSCSTSTTTRSILPAAPSPRTTSPTFPAM